MAASEQSFQSSRLEAYECLLANARAMFNAASEGRWDELIALDSERTACLTDVASSGPISTNPVDVERTGVMIQAILDFDERAKSLIHARQLELRELLDSVDNERKLTDVYRDR